MLLIMVSASWAVRLTAWPLTCAFLWLGLFFVPAATASCAGPQLVLTQDGQQPQPRRVGHGDDERSVYDVDVSRPLTVRASNLTRTCVDTWGGTAGCAGRSPTATPSVEPMDGAQLVLVQGSHRWPLATFDEITPDLTAEVVVDLPASTRPGPATLQVGVQAEEMGTVLDLVLR